MQYIIPALFGGSWIAHILDIEYDELYVIDTEPDLMKRVSRDYTDHVAGDHAIVCVTEGVVACYAICTNGECA